MEQVIKRQILNRCPGLMVIAHTHAHTHAHARTRTHARTHTHVVGPGFDLLIELVLILVPEWRVANQEDVEDYTLQGGKRHRVSQVTEEELSIHRLVQRPGGPEPCWPVGPAIIVQLLEMVQRGHSRGLSFNQ